MYSYFDASVLDAVHWTQLLSTEYILIDDYTHHTNNGTRDGNNEMFTLEPNTSHFNQLPLPYSLTHSHTLSLALNPNLKIVCEFCMRAFIRSKIISKTSIYITVPFKSTQLRIRFADICICVRCHTQNKIYKILYQITRKVKILIIDMEKVNHMLWAVIWNVILIHRWHHWRCYVTQKPIIFVMPSKTFCDGRKAVKQCSTRCAKHMDTIQWKK